MEYHYSNHPHFRYGPRILLSTSYPTTREYAEKICFSLVCGSAQTNPRCYFAPFYQGLRKLETEGVNVTIPDEAISSFISKVVVICGTCDLPAKCLVCNTVQYNGFYGCGKCEIPGRTIKTFARGHMHAFPFNADDI